VLVPMTPFLAEGRKSVKTSLRRSLSRKAVAWDSEAERGHAPSVA
jgi:hypothetical protein